jgi:hypothetical protein
MLSTDRTELVGLLDGLLHSIHLGLGFSKLVLESGIEVF